MVGRPRTLRPKEDEVDAIQSAMRDVQVSIEHYYRLTTGFIENAEHFTTPVRATIAFIQKVNDVFRNDFGQSSKYRKIFEDQLAANDLDAETLNQPA